MYVYTPWWILHEGGWWNICWKDNVWNICTLLGILQICTRTRILYALEFCHCREDSGVQGCISVCWSPEFAKVYILKWDGNHTRWLDPSKRALGLLRQDVVARNFCLSQNQSNKHFYSAIRPCFFYYLFLPLLLALFFFCCFFRCVCIVYIGMWCVCKRKNVFMCVHICV